MRRKQVELVSTTQLVHLVEDPKEHFPKPVVSIFGHAPIIKNW